MRGRTGLPLGILALSLLVLAACDPEGALDSAVGTAGAPGRVVVSGWAYDADVPDTVVAVRIDVDYVPVAVVAADRSRPDVAAAKGYRDNTGFLAEVSARPGVRVVCVHALNVAGTDGADVLLGCAFVTVPATQPTASSLTVVSGSSRAPYTEGLRWSIADPQGEPVTCRIDWDGGAWDDVIPGCQARLGATHTYAEPGSYQVAVEMTDGNSGVSMAYRTVTVSGFRTEAFDVAVRNNGGFTASQSAVVSAAASRWSGLVSTGVGDVSLLVAAGECEPGLPPFAGVVDDLLVDVIATPLDGPGRVLAAAGPCIVRSSSGLPIYGVLVVDSADVGRLETEGRLADTVLHELGHVLGIGTLWSPPTLIGAGTSDPRFVGPMASIPFNAASTGWPSVPVENSGGPGTADAHWRESVLGDELMTGYLDAVNPLSAVTVGSLADIGYGVDVRGADPLPRPSLRAADPESETLLAERLIRPHRNIG